jgi:hypothetical protein
MAVGTRLAQQFAQHVLPVALKKKGTGRCLYSNCFLRPYAILRAGLLPDVDSTLGPLTYADVDSWLLEVRLNLKYRFLS